MTDQVLNLTFVGLIIVFSVLAIISFTISMVRKLDDKWQTYEKEHREAATEKTQTIDNVTLVLISATVATVVGGRFNIHKVRVLSTRAKRTPWSSQGRAVLLGSHTISRKND